MKYPGPDLPPKPTKAQRVEYEAGFNKWRDAERLRIKRQRAVFAQSIWPGHAAPLIDAILDRAWFLLDAGEAEAADALLEFLPEDVATKLLDEFFGDEPKPDDPAGPPSE